MNKQAYLQNYLKNETIMQIFILLVVSLVDNKYNKRFKPESWTALSTFVL